MASAMIRAMPNAGFLVDPPLQGHPEDDAPPTRDWLLRLPKVDLHCHLGGSLRFETLVHEIRSQRIEDDVVRVARAHGLPLERFDVDALRAVLLPGVPFSSLEGYLSRFPLTEMVLRTRAALRRAAYELAEDAHRESVRYLEVRFAPANYRTPTLSLRQVVESVVEGLQAAETELGIRTGVIISAVKCVMEIPDGASPEERERILARQRDLRESIELAAVLKTMHDATAYPIGFDLCGPEDGYRPKVYSELFEPIFLADVPVTIHAGEGYGPKSIFEALIWLNAERIGHGTRLYQNPSLMRKVKNRRIPLEVCPTSNVDTRTTVDICVNPLQIYLKHGLRVVLCTDNRLMSNTTLTDEYVKVSTEFGLTRRQCKLLALNGFKSTFLDYAERKALQRRAIGEMDGL